MLDEVVRDEPGKLLKAGLPRDALEVSFYCCFNNVTIVDSRMRICNVPMIGVWLFAEVQEGSSAEGCPKVRRKEGKKS